jgi:hypothetical protein
MHQLIYIYSHNSTRSDDNFAVRWFATNNVAERSTCVYTCRLGKGQFEFRECIEAAISMHMNVRQLAYVTKTKLRFFKHA